VTGPAYEPARCAVCGHADAELVADADDIRAEREALWAYHETRLRPDIPPSRLVDRLAFSEPPPFRLVRCTECGLVYRNPVERPRELTEVYARDAAPRDTLAALHESQRSTMHDQARRLRRALGRGGSGLEVGSYVGAFLAAAREEGLHIEGLDVNARVNEFTRSLGLTVHDGELTSFNTDRTFDVVAIWNTFDQLADPRAALMATHKLLRPSGLLVIRVPNGGCYAALRRRFGRASPGGAARAMLAQNNLLGFPYRWGFTPRALSRLLVETGFRVDRVRGDVLVRVGDEWTRRWARLEELVMKAALRIIISRASDWAPWIEVYASRT
jgi:SAM-dependent methyltransferase